MQQISTDNQDFRGNLQKMRREKLFQALKNSGVALPKDAWQMTLGDLQEIANGAIMSGRFDPNRPVAGAGSKPMPVIPDVTPAETEAEVSSFVEEMKRKTPPQLWAICRAHEIPFERTDKKTVLVEKIKGALGV